jgi:transposase-like protein
MSTNDKQPIEVARNRRISIGDECPRCGSQTEHSTNTDESMYVCATCGELWDGADWAIGVGR